MKRRPLLNKHDGCMTVILGAGLSLLGLFAMLLSGWGHEPEAIPYGSIAFGAGLLLVLGGTLLYLRDNR